MRSPVLAAAVVAVWSGATPGQLTSGGGDEIVLGMSTALTGPPGMGEREGGGIMQVSDYMTPDPFVVCCHEPVDEIVDLLRRHGVHQIPVVNEDRQIVGIITERDIRSAARQQEPATPHKQAGDVMTREVITVTPGTHLDEAVETLCRERFGALPVVVGGHVVGILSSRDLLRRLMEFIGAQRTGPLEHILQP